MVRHAHEGAALVKIAAQQHRHPRGGEALCLNGLLQTHGSLDTIHLTSRMHVRGDAHEVVEAQRAGIHCAKDQKSSNLQT